MTPNELWNLTPREFNIKIEAYGKNEEKRTKELIVLAYYTAGFQREKKLKPLKDIINKMFKSAPAKKRIENTAELDNVARNKGIVLPGGIVE